MESLFGMCFDIICESTNQDRIKWKHITTRKEAEMYDDKEPNFSAKIEFTKGNVYMAEHTNDGYIGFIQVTSDGFIENIVVNLSKQGKGYGNKFVEKCLQLGGCKLHTNIKNERAINLYTKYGFSITGKTLNGKMYVMEK